MAREIKFRAWNPNDCEILIPFDEGHGDWWWFDSDENGNPVVVIRDIKTCHVTLDQDYKITHHPEFPIMQYTGLTDKNGKEIYEGDYLEVKSLCFFGEDRNCRGVVDFLECGFVVTDRKTFSNPLFVENCDIEILGNVFENPELI